MIVGTAEIKLYAPWVYSLKEKRMIVKSLIARTRNKFNVSIAEIAEQDTHQTIVLGLACVAGSISHSDSIIDNVISLIESSTEAEITDIVREIR
ncbi:MAG: DUF503 domain-containing protein [Negativicutes bacterium]|nr:DUF503 domain-containing protein [Negativicutes bacterium]